MFPHTIGVLRKLFIVFACAGGMLASSGSVLAQGVTTGNLSGGVVDDQGGVLPGVSVTAVHEPTGTEYTAVTEGDGRFRMLNVRVGGPYKVSVLLAGFRAQTRDGVMVNLGEETPVDFTLQLETVQETVTVTAEANSVFSGSKAGTSASIEQATLEALPSVQRSLQDFARVNPFVSQTATNANDSTLSIAGRSGRYNNLQIDGAVNNDLFGLADSGTPGGPASTQPVSLDAIQELQIVVSPYDVRQGGFSGGGINAITRSGANKFSGTGYYFFRDQGLVGDGADDRPIATFNDKQFGGSLGGPIVRNKAFFFGNIDFGRKDTPSGFSVDGSSGQAFGRQEEIQRALNVAQSKYGYDPGGLGEFIRATNNNKVFARADMNFGRNQLTVRNNYVDAINDVLFPTITLYKFPDQNYRFNSKTNSTVVQLNSAIGSKFNEFRVSYQRIRDVRATDTRFPQVTIRLDGRWQLPLRHRAVLGRERARPGHHRTARRPDVRPRQAHVHRGHAQRVLQVPQPLHPRQLRHLRVRERVAVRGGHRAGVRLQLLGHVRPEELGAFLGVPVRLLRGRSVARRAELHGHLRRAARLPGVPRQAH